MILKNVFQDPRIKTETERIEELPDGWVSSEDDDEIINPAELAEEMEWEELCAHPSGDCSSMPAKQKMEIKVAI